MEDIRDVLRADLVTAKKAREAETVSLLRTLIAAIENAEAVDPATTDGASEVPRRELNEADLHNIMTRESHDLLQAADHYDQIGHPTEAQRLRSLADVVDNYAALIPT